MTRPPRKSLPAADETLVPMHPAAHWVDWQAVDPHVRLTPRVLAELLDGGQSFRWWPQHDGSWLGQWSDNVVALRLGTRQELQWRTLVGASPPSATALRHYLGLDGRTHADALEALPWRSDAHLARCLAAFPGLRILHQPFGETLLGFLCSATKQIVQIKQMLALLAKRLGDPIGTATEDTSPASLNTRGNGAIGWCLPSWSVLATAPEAELRSCLLGFRARYIKGTAERIASNPGWLAQVEAAPYEQARLMLCELPGVGEKVADCVLLFGAGRWQAFPVDVWILRTLATRYGLEGWTPRQVAQFGRAHFGAHAGLAQQFLFAYERAAGATNRAADGVTASRAESIRPRTLQARR